MRLWTIGLLACAALYGQEFEVATVKPAAPLIAGSAASAANVGIHIDGTQFRAGSLALRDYLAMGFNMRQYQIVGPDWVGSERYDISGKIPDGVKVDTALAPMVRALLEERMHLKTHVEKKEFPVYALVQTGGGIKAKESPLDAVDAAGVTVGSNTTAQGTTVNMGRGVSLAVGGNRIEARKYGMLALADTLARFVDRPVVDETGLKSTYDFTLEMTPEDFRALTIRAALAAGVTLPPQALQLMEAASGDSLHSELAKIGLKLENKKVPLDVLVIDSVNKVPDEN